MEFVERHLVVENRHTIKAGGSFVMNYAPSVYLCVDGDAVIIGDNYKKIKKGDYFFLPYVAEGKFKVFSESNATLIECLPSKQ